MAKRGLTCILMCIMNNPIDQYRQLRSQVDQQAAVLESCHSDHMACQKGCCGCCLNLSVWPVEFYSILEEMKSAGWKKPVLNEDKDCVFLDGQGSCQIYPFRPMICRTHGLPLVYWHDETDPPGWGVMFCEQNFTEADEIAFGPDNTLNMDTINEKLARLNVAFVEAHPELDLTPQSRIELKQLVDDLK